MSALNASVAEENKWGREVCKIQRGLNNTLNKSIGKTPCEVLLGYTPRGKAKTGILNDIGVKRYHNDREKTREKVAEKIKKGQKRTKARYDLRRAPAKIFKLGDAVGARKDIASNDGKSKKLLDKYVGPYEVKNVLDKDRYVIGDIKGYKVSQKPYTAEFPGERLRDKQ